MVRRSMVEEFRGLFDSKLGGDEVAFIYLGYSGIILRTADRAVLIDPADLLRDEEIRTLTRLDLLLFTHSHSDHYNPGAAVKIFKASAAHVMAEPLTANNLRGKIPGEKLTSAMPGDTYSFNGIVVRPVKGVHRGPINLYQLRGEDISIFHAGDSGYVPVENFKSDLAFLPTGAPSPTASPEYAFKMALELKPRVAVAIHGSPSQSRAFEEKIRRNMPKTKTIIPEQAQINVVSLR